MKNVYFGFNMPFLGGPQNVMSMQSGDRIIKNDLRQLLLTSPGERIYRPKFGSPIKGALFDQLTEADIPALRRGIANAIRDYEERVTVNEILIQLNQDEQTLYINVNVSPNDDPARNFLVELNLPLGA